MDRASGSATTTTTMTMATPQQSQKVGGSASLQRSSAASGASVIGGLAAVSAPPQHRNVRKRGSAPLLVTGLESAAFVILFYTGVLLWHNNSSVKAECINFDLTSSSVHWRL